MPAHRVRTLESLRVNVRENGGKLLVPNLKKLFQSLSQCLADPDHHIPMQALGLLADIAPDCLHDVGNYIPLILVRCLSYSDFQVYFLLNAFFCN